MNGYQGRREAPRLADIEEILWRRLDLLQRSQEEGDHTADVAGRSFNVRRGVFSPKYFESTHAFAALLEFEPGTSLLEIGTGCGALSILAALRGADPVWATDLSEEAVANARENATSHGVERRVSFFVADVFKGLAVRKFDKVFWNPPWVSAPPSFEPTVLQRSVCDPGYRAIADYFQNAALWLAPRGVLMMGFASLGDEVQLEKVSAQFGWQQCNQASVPSHDTQTVFKLLTFRAV